MIHTPVPVNGYLYYFPLTTLNVKVVVKIIDVKIHTNAYQSDVKVNRSNNIYAVILPKIHANFVEILFVRMV